MDGSRGTPSRCRLESPARVSGGRCEAGAGRKKLSRNPKNGGITAREKKRERQRGRERERERETEREREREREGR